MLKLQDIVKDYEVAGNKVRAVDGLSLEFRRSEFVAILGQSGCGKTTTMNIVGGLDKYTSGDLLVDGQSTKEYKDSDWDNYRNKRVGFVFQSYNLIPHLTVLANVELALTISGVSLAERKQLAKDALISVGLQEHLSKKPNQLSGGQMQRVAIARAIVNKPEILLADEPTGALDSKTSVQIMTLIKEIAKDRLVIMVTHNPELAQEYATRLVTMQDGKVTTDSNPYDSNLSTPSNFTSNNLISQQAPPPQTIVTTTVVKNDNQSTIITTKTQIKLKKQKASMSFLTALKLSFQNLLTKKKRSILTSIACAIGIIGIGLVMAISNGVNVYIDRVSAEQVESVPLTISNNTYYLDDEFAEQARDSKNINSLDTRDVGINNTDRERETIRMSPEIIDFIQKNTKDEWMNKLYFNTGKRSYLYATQPDGTYSQPMMINNSILIGDFASLLGQDGPARMIPSLELLEKQFDLIEGSLPTNPHEIVFVANNPTNEGEPVQIDSSDLAQMGFGGYFQQGQTKITSKDIFNIRYKIPTNNQIYTQGDNGVFTSTLLPNPLKPILDDPNFEKDGGITLKISGIVRAKWTKDPKATVLYSGLGYVPELIEEIQKTSLTSDIIQFMKQYTTINQNGEEVVQNIFDEQGNLTVDVNAENTFINPTSGSFYKREIVGSVYQSAYYQYSQQLHLLGGDDSPWSISAYFKNIESKNAFVSMIKDYNANKIESEQINYNDILETLVGVVLSTVGIISSVLIGFTAISLVVSAVMISIITSISVLERTKEIGILRSIGARKKDVNRLFNAENFILGLFSGVIGVIFTGLISLVISAILSSVLGITGIASMTGLTVLILLLVSTGVSLLAGFLPSRAAAKKDPVLALRSE